MDAVQFGRWLHDQRRKLGYSSQRALVERIQQQPALAQHNISEAFLARLETGQLAHPFRGGVRLRVLALAELLCRSPRELSIYLRAAELTELSSNEATYVSRLRARLAPGRSQPTPSLPRLLPPRPQHLVGRQLLLDELLDDLRRPKNGLYLLSGMPGVGKSALAAELIHLFIEAEPNYQGAILYFACRGYRGNQGLITLCEHLLELSGSRTMPARSEAASYAHDPSEAEVSRVLNRVRLALNPHAPVLFFLDDLEAEFPLRQFLDTLTVSAPAPSSLAGVGDPPIHRSVLVTSRYRFTPLVPARQLHLEPLTPAAALEYLGLLLAQRLTAAEQVSAAEICSSVGYLPLALEGVALLVGPHLPLALLNNCLAEHSLSVLLESEYALRSRLEEAFAALDRERQTRFALLSLPGSLSLSLELAATLHTLPVSVESGPSTAHLTRTALDLGQLVRHSLVEARPSRSAIPTYAGGGPSDPQPTLAQVRYHLHPVMLAYGQRRLLQLDPLQLEVARGNLQLYTLAYLERYRDQLRALLEERDLLFTGFTQALQNNRPAEVIQFVTGLAPISCRLRRREDGDYLFTQGIQASLQLHDQQQQINFINGLGWLHCQRGAFASARQAWLEILDLAANSPNPYWQPLLNLAHLAHLSHDENNAIHYAESFLQRAHGTQPPRRMIYPHVLLGLYKRLAGDYDGAVAALETAERLFRGSEDHELQTRYPDLARFLELRLRVEWMRVLKDYPASHAAVFNLLPYLEAGEEHYDIADLLLDQVSFAIQQQREEQILPLARRIVQAAEQVDATHALQLGQLLIRQANGNLELSGKNPLRPPLSLSFSA